MNLIEGAKVLADLLEKRHGTKMSVRAAGPVQATGALPLFYWLGVEPPTAPVPEVRVEIATRPAPESAAP